MPFENYRVAVARAARLVRRHLTPWRSLSEAAQTYRRQCRHVATLVHWLSNHWQETQNFEKSDLTSELLWQLSGELLRMKHRLVQVFAEVSGEKCRDILEHLQDADALNQHIPEPQGAQEEED